MVHNLEKAYQKQLKTIDDALKSERERVLAELSPQMEADVAMDVSGGLITRDAAIKRWQHNTEKTLKAHNLLSEILHGFDLINQYRNQVLTVDEKSHYEKDLKVCLDKIHHSGKKQKEHDTGNALHIMQAAFGISDFLMNCFHKIAFYLYQKDILQDSKSIYLLLTSLNPYIPAFYSALAAIDHKLGSADEALGFAAMAAALDVENPRCHLLYATLLMDHGNKSSAKDEVAKAEELIKKAKTAKHDHDFHKEDIEDLQALKLELAHA